MWLGRNLHSTMYLLNLRRRCGDNTWCKHLHSTMYLLNPTIQFINQGVAWVFTFHYVSIKSKVRNNMTEQDCNLHSTMYLLNRLLGHYTVLTKQFTFHYVSIKSAWNSSFPVCWQNLHSTMYLLNRSSGIGGLGVSRKFTFHYVSIKSLILRGRTS